MIHTVECGSASQLVLYMCMAVLCVLCPRPVPWESGLEYRLDVAPGYHGSTSLSNLARLCSDNSER